MLRWSWRVGYYATSALGTDRYPPFTLDDADYPASLDVVYPERLSRGLVLVKSWLLAIPHLLILGVLTATWPFVGDNDGVRFAFGGGLLGILVGVAAVILIVTGRYPVGLHDLIVGINRWIYRVIAYVALMTDDYPPFRLDQGGPEPATSELPPPGPPLPPPTTDARDPVSIDATTIDRQERQMHTYPMKDTTMTSTTTSRPVRAPTRRRRSVRRPIATRSHRDSVAAIPNALASEWTKLRSLRSNLAILCGTTAIGIVLVWVLAVFVKTDPDTREAFTIGNSFSFPTWLSTVMAVVAGILMFTSEVQHGTLAAVITAQPARWVTVTAKSAIAAGFGLAMGVAGMIAGLLGGVLGGLDAGDTSGMPATAAWGLMVTTVAAIFGLGIGMIVRHSSAAISMTLVWVFVIENLLRELRTPDRLSIPAVQSAERTAEHRDDVRSRGPRRRPHTSAGRPAVQQLRRRRTHHRNRSPLPPRHELTAARATRSYGTTPMSWCDPCKLVPENWHDGVMADLATRAQQLLDLHHSGTTLVLPTVWDAWSANAVVAAGFPALTIGSHPLADSRGQGDNEAMSLDDALDGIRRITAAVDVPVSADMESGYDTAAPELVERVLDAGAVGHQHRRHRPQREASALGR